MATMAKAATATHRGIQSDGGGNVLKGPLFGDLVYQKVVEPTCAGTCESLVPTNPGECQSISALIYLDLQTMNIIVEQRYKILLKK